MESIIDTDIQNIEEVKKMSLTVKEMVKQNNEKRKLLTSDNETYYENLLVYIRTNAFRKERETEEVLLELLDHLLEAQKEGKTGQDVFGKSPQQLAEEIIESLPKETFKNVIEFSIEIILTLFGWFLVVWGFLPLIQKLEQTIYLGTLLVSAILLFGVLLLLVILTFTLIRRNAFSEKRKKPALLFGMLIWIVFMIVLLCILFAEPFGPIITINFYTGFGLGCFFLLASYILKKSREAK